MIIVCKSYTPRKYIDGELLQIEIEEPDKEITTDECLNWLMVEIGFNGILKKLNLKMNDVVEAA